MCFWTILIVIIVTLSQVLSWDPPSSFTFRFAFTPILRNNIDISCWKTYTNRVFNTLCGSNDLLILRERGDGPLHTGLFRIPNYFIHQRQVQCHSQATQLQASAVGPEQPTSTISTASASYQQNRSQGEFADTEAFPPPRYWERADAGNTSASSCAHNSSCRHAVGRRSTVSDNSKCTQQYGSSYFLSKVSDLEETGGYGRCSSALVLALPLQLSQKPRYEDASGKQCEASQRTRRGPSTHEICNILPYRTCSRTTLTYS